MKNKFIRCLSPITAIVTIAIGASVALNGYYAAQKIMEKQTNMTIMYAIIEVLAVIIFALMLKELLKNGIKFGESIMEFTGIDDNNVFEYSRIVKVESSRDTAASLSKNFVDRYSHIIIYLDDDTVTTIDLGLTTKKTLANIENEINSRINHRGEQ